MDTKTPENKKNSPRLKVLIIILSVLLVLSAGGLAAKYVYDNFFASDRASVTVPDAGQDGEQDTEQNAVQDGQNDPEDDADEPEDGTNAGSDTADDDTANGGTTDVGTGNGGQSDGADA